MTVETKLGAVQTLKNEFQRPIRQVEVSDSTALRHGSLAGVATQLIYEHIRAP
jgi:hypothetical protein